MINKINPANEKPLPLKDASPFNVLHKLVLQLLQSFVSHDPILQPLLNVVTLSKALRRKKTIN